MKHRLFILTLCLFLGITLQAQNKQRVVVGAIGVDVNNPRSLNALIDEFQEALIYGGGERYEVRNGQDEFNKFIKDEFAIQATGYIDDSQLTSIGNALGAQYICGIVVEYNDAEKDYYFRAKMISVETDEVKKTARYPNEIEGDAKVFELSRYNLQKVALLLIKRLDILSEKGDSKLASRMEQLHIQEGRISEESRIKTEQINAQQRKQRRAYNANNLYESLLKPYSEWGTYIGYNGAGFEWGVDFSYSFLHLGFGFGLLNGNLPICEPEPFNAYFSLAATIGINTKYVGVAVSPHIFFNDEREAEIKKAFAINPEIYFNIPIDPYGNSIFDGIRLTLGYSIMPQYDYNPGIAVKVGFFDCF